MECRNYIAVPPSDHRMAVNTSTGCETQQSDWFSVIIYTSKKVWVKLMKPPFCCLPHILKINWVDFFLLYFINLITCSFTWLCFSHTLSVIYGATSGKECSLRISAQPMTWTVNTKLFQIAATSNLRLGLTSKTHESQARKHTQATNEIL